MKRRLTFLAAAVVLVDLLALSAVWHVSPTLSLTVGLVVPEVEQILAPLYPEPVREDVASGELHRPARLRSALVLTGESADLRMVARALARRDIAVVVPASAAALDATVAYARTLGVPVRVESVASFHDADARATVSGRATYAWRLLRFSHSLLTPS
jgi:hypothetical protein